jgi:hypothetical protein
MSIILPAIVRKIYFPQSKERSREIQKSSSVTEAIIPLSITGINGKIGPAAVILHYYNLVRFTQNTQYITICDA